MRKYTVLGTPRPVRKNLILHDVHFGIEYPIQFRNAGEWAMYLRPSIRLRVGVREHRHIVKGCAKYKINPLRYTFYLCVDYVVWGECAFLGVSQ